MTKLVIFKKNFYRRRSESQTYYKKEVCTESHEGSNHNHISWVLRVEMGDDQSKVGIILVKKPIFKVINQIQCSREVMFCQLC